MSNDQFFIRLNKVMHGSTVPLPHQSINWSTSGAKYSGVVAGTDQTFVKMKDDPKSISLRFLICFPSNSTRMLSGLMSACTMSK